MWVNRDDDDDNSAPRSKALRRSLERIFMNFASTTCAAICPGRKALALFGPGHWSEMADGY